MNKLIEETFLDKPLWRVTTIKDNVSKQLIDKLIEQGCDEETIEVFVADEVKYNCCTKLLIRAEGECESFDE